MKKRKGYQTLASAVNFLTDHAIYDDALELSDAPFDAIKLLIVQARFLREAEEAAPEVL